ncbi:extracellular solute-binding protein [Paenibacillus sp. LMG 31461]|uniref:Extracellular solute-binding protein n=1 Tax=Paenibacillus plantarum TaxID=2654975 RepID=A0ABX1XBN6_9BACL|nr:extracellular solute-binding protein [Paenibacillus plantarum]NOU65857.1 extracellular solute-binding protein [Paenibacillus plantarum]
MVSIRIQYKKITVTLSVVSVLACFIAYGCTNRFSNKQARMEQGNEAVTDHGQLAKIHIQYAQMSVTSVKFVEEAIHRFNETNQDNIYIDLLKIPRDRYTETLNMLNASGKGPDVYEVSKEWLTSYMYKGWIEDLSAYVDESFFKPFPKWAVEFAKNSRNKDKFYTIPSNQITYRLIYNKDLFRKAGLNPESPPTTLDQVKKYATIISEAEKGARKYGFALPIGEEWGGLVQPMEATSAYSGVYFYNFQNGTYDLAGFKPWLTTYKSMEENGALFPGMGAMKDDLATAQFAEGNIGMMYAASWKPTLFAEQYPPKNEWGVAMPPATSEATVGKGAVSIHAAGLNVVKSGTAHLQEAVKVWKYLYSIDYIGKLYQSGSLIPVMEGVLDNPRYTPSIAHFNEFLPGSRDSIYPDTPLNMDEWARSKAYISAIGDGKSIDEALQAESNRLNTLLNAFFTTFGVNKSDYTNSYFDPQHPLEK